MTYNGIGIIFVFIDKLFGSGERYLIDVLVDIIGCHAYTVVSDSECACILVDLDLNAHIPELSFEFSKRSKSLKLLRSVNGVSNKLAQKYLII